MMHTAQFVGTTQLQQEPSVITNVSITMSVDHTPLYPSILSNVCVEVSQRTVDSLALTLQKASLISSTNSRYSALEFGPYNCCKRSECPNSFNLNVHILPASRIHSSTVCQLRVCKNTPPQPGKNWLNAGVVEFPPIVQLNSIRTTTLSRRDANSAGP